MTTHADTFWKKFGSADAPTIARWFADRFMSLRHRVVRRLSLWKMQLADSRACPGSLPPGPLTASSPRDAAADEGYYRRLHRAYGTIFKIFWGSGHLRVCLVGQALGRRLFKEHRDSLEPVTEDLSALIPQNFLRGMRPEAHRRYRRLFMAGFCDDLVDGCDAGVRQIVRGELSRLAGPANSNLPPPQRLYNALNQISLKALLFVILGVKPDTEGATKLEPQFHRLGPRGHVELVGPPQADAFAVIKQAVEAVAQSLPDPKSGDRSDSVIKRVAEKEPASMADDTVIGNLIYLVERGRHDLRDLLRWIVKHLSDHPEVVDDLRAALADPSGAPMLAAACVMETLRLEQAEALSRRARTRLTADGYDIPKGSWIAFLLRESHRDPAHFIDPNGYCPHRFIDRNYSLDQYSPFGLDDHQCPAGPLVIRMASALIEELVKGYSWTVISDGPRHDGKFHWEPSPSFAIDLRPRA